MSSQIAISLRARNLRPENLFFFTLTLFFYYNRRADKLSKRQNKNYSGMGRRKKKEPHLKGVASVRLD